MNAKANVKRLTSMAVMTAVSIVLVTLIHFPIIPAASFLEYDPADIPILLTALIFGPLAGLAVTVAASLIQGLTVSSASGMYGVLMHILATGAYVLMTGILNKKLGKRPWGNIVSVAAGCAAMLLVMIPANLIITPIFMNTPVDAVKQMLLPAIIPFNLIKAGINGAAAVIIYKSLTASKIIKFD